jgi:RNA polymerase sigma-70 factor (ECF subfamily)
VTNVARAATLRNFSPAVAQCSGEVDDVALLERIRRGDADAVSALFARHQGPIYRYAAHMCGRDAADDVVQETFLAVLRRSGQYDATRGPVGNYLLGIARHFVLRRLGARYADARADADEHLEGIEMDQPTVLDSLTRAETIETVRAAIGSLPAAYREVVVLCELQEMTYEAAAGVMQCPVGTIRSRLHRARALLVTKLSAIHPAADMRK